MALSNAERQERHRARIKARAAAGITRDDVLRAVQIYREAYSRETSVAVQPWGEWLNEVSKPSRAKLWQEFVPTSTDPQDYPAGLAAIDLELLLRVAAVSAACLQPPTD